MSHADNAFSTVSAAKTRAKQGQNKGCRSYRWRMLSGACDPLCVTKMFRLWRHRHTGRHLSLPPSHKVFYSTLFCPCCAPGYLIDWLVWAIFPPFFPFLRFGEVFLGGGGSPYCFGAGVSPILCSWRGPFFGGWGRVSPVDSRARPTSG